jgi:hypothetical protein
MLMMAGCGGTATTSSNVTATPTFSPGGGTYSTTQQVTISDTTSGAVLYCTTDGTTPTTSSRQCAQPVSVYNSEYLQAIAVAPGKTASAVASAGYTIDLNAAPIPNFSPAGGTYLSSQAPVTVTLSDAVAGANIYYTTDGTVPSVSTSTSSSTKLYTAPISVSATQTVNAIAVASNFDNSGMASATYTIAPVAPQPTFSIAGATYTTPQQVGLGDSISGATIYYTLDGTTPTTSSLVYKGVPLTVSNSVTINAMAVASGYVNSAVASATYAINLQPAPSPTFSLTLASLSIYTVDGTTVYYTTDGSTPTTSSPAYGGPIPVTEGEVVQVIAAGTIYLNSPVSSYVVDFPVASTPTFSLSLATLTIKDATTGATIHYTVDGSIPSTSSPVYSTPFTVTEGEVVQAIAAGTGLVTSPSATDTIAFQPVPEPTFSPTSGLNSTVPLTITINGVAGETIYYTINGDTPTTSSNQYNGPFTLSSTATVKAIGVANAVGFANSDVASATYTIVPGNTALSGSVVSGGTTQKVVKGAAVQLYTAGASGYGSSGATLLAQAITTDNTGAFSLTFNCPAATTTTGDDLVYLVATGGDAGSGANSNIKLMTALGSCNSSSFPKTATVNEVTTIASAYALSAFATIPTSGGGIDIGAPATQDADKAPSCDANDGWKSTGPNTCNYNGLVSAFKAVNNLVNVTGTIDAYGVAAGAARSITPAYANGTTPKYSTTGGTYSGPAFPAVPYLNSSTVPKDRINALADMLASCVESNAGSACSGSNNLFGAAATTTTTPGDTLQAALNIAQNPGNNVTALLGLIRTSNPPYATAVGVSEATPPVDLALALTFTGAGLGLNPTTSLDSSGNGLLSTTINGTDWTQIAPSVDTTLAVDASGNVWVAAFVNSELYGAGWYNSVSPYLAVFDNLGTPLTPPTTVSGTTAIFGGFSPDQSNNANAPQLNQIAFDQAGNLWVAEYSYGADPLLKVSGFPSSLSSTSVINNLGIPNAMAVDGNIASGQAAGNVWVFNANDELYEVSSSGSAGLDSQFNFQALGAYGYYPYATVFDSAENMWVTTKNTSNYPAVGDIVKAASAPFPYSFGSTPIFDGYSSGNGNANVGGGWAPPVADGSNNVYVCGDLSGTVVDTFTGAGKQSSFTPVSGLGCGNQMVLDGQGHLFAVTNTRNTNFPLYGSYLDEFTTSGLQIFPELDASPGSSSAEPPTLAADPYFNGAVPGISAAMDASGNLWVMNNDTNGVNNSSVATPVNVLVEYVGIGAPVVTPTSVALSNQALGARP